MEPLLFLLVILNSSPKVSIFVAYNKTDIIMPNGLSKSRYTAFCQCPKNLWLKVYQPEEAKDDPALQARFEQGNEVGDLAMGLFGPYKEVTTHNADGSLDLNKMCELT